MPEAIHHLRVAVNFHNSKQSILNSNMSIALEKENKHIESLAARLRAVKIEPKGCQLHFNVAKSFSELGMHTEAIHHYKEAVKLNPDYNSA
jgi:tetratricopeptide (TPR) repeat protein